jgi:hypothetical protein
LPGGEETHVINVSAIETKMDGGEMIGAYLALSLRRHRHIDDYLIRRPKRGERL